MSMSRILVLPFITLIKIYQKTLSVWLGPKCKYYPSCSQYAMTAINRYGFKGVVMAAWRLLRCNPWSDGGVDYVDADLDSADAKFIKNNSNKNNLKKEVVGAGL